MALDAGKAQSIDRLGHRGGIVGRRRRKRHGRVAGALTDAADPGGGIAIEDRAIFRKGDFARRFLQRRPVGILGAALDVVDRLARQRERNAQFDERLDYALHRLDALARRLDRLGVAGAYGRERRSPSPPACPRPAAPPDSA